MDVSSVRSRDAEFYYSLLDPVVKEIGESYIVQIVTDNEAPSVAKVLDEAKKVTCFIYNHIWTIDLMKKYTQGKQILRPALTRFSTHFIQLEEIKGKSKEFKESKWGLMKPKKLFWEKIFGKKANGLIKVYEPLVKVLRLMDGDKKPTMGFIYEAINRAKQAIQQDCQYFTEYEKIIDNR
ncbi:hypothetical protein Goshw_021378 [Gossypium schwendimanii]|uniref:DUF659 domain-containing protein n=1 Tax=Gossypium schwendimanii TaxID=34291 RepID=A0A7J9LPZ6_GOSSC|nr:hypothetical protein [Gossypium schwendimanii]